jgi:DNA repair protein RadD
VIVAGIQSIYKKACDLGRFDLVIIDEVHLVPADGDGMYQTLLADLRVINPAVRVIGLTATPYRLDSGTICGPDRLLSDICYQANVKDLIDQGYLSSLRGKNGGSPDLSGVHKRGGEYIEAELAEVMSAPEKVAHAVAEMRRHGADRQAWLVFCCGIAHAQMVAAEIAAAGIGCEVVTGETPSAERKRIIDAYKARELRCLVNVSVLTTGFDAPHVDMVVMLRPTCSPGLYAQIVGRGLRKADGKTDCLILDLAGNIEAHGPVDRIRPPKDKSSDGGGTAPQKTCPQCEEIHHAAMQSCPACGYAYPPPEMAKHGTEASDASPLSAPIKRFSAPIVRTEVAVHIKKGSTPGDGTPRTVRVTYWADMRTRFNEWICVEHKGYARTKAEKWFSQIGGDPRLLPRDAEEACEVLAEHFQYCPVSSIDLAQDGEEWPEIVKREVANAKTLAQVPGSDDDEPPF